MPFVQRVIEPRHLSRTTLFDADGKPRVKDSELEAVTNNTLCNALRQLASLAVAANDIFVDFTRQLQDIARRSDLLKDKIGAVQEKVAKFDPKKVAVPVSDICTFALRKEHFKKEHNLDTNLFSSTSRPRSVQVLYEAAVETPISLMRQMDRWRRDGHRSSEFFVCTPVLGAKRRKIRTKVDIDIETRMPAAVEELRRWTSTEALGDITVAQQCSNRIALSVTDGNVTDGTIASDDEAIDHKLPSPEEQVQVVALKFPAEIVAVDVSGRAFSRMSIQRRSLLHGDLSKRTEDGSQSRSTRSRKPRNRRRNTLAGTDQKEIQNALTAGDEISTPSVESSSPQAGPVLRSKSTEPLPKRESSSSFDAKKSHFQTLKQWGKNRLKMINKSDGSKSENNKSEDPSTNLYETVSLKRKRSFNKDKRPVHERKPSYSSSEKSSISIPIASPFTTAMSNIAVKLRESSAQRRRRRSGGNKDEPHSSSGNWSASSESGRASIGSEITTTTIPPKSSTSATTSTNSLNQHAPGSINSRRKFHVNNSGSSSITSEGTLTPDIHDFHEDGETSSVYSCDTEGYYTSFHMDSGLKTLKEEDTPPTPLHSTSAFSHSSSSNTILTAENEYELFGKGSTSTTASSAGTVCTTLRATGSSKSLTVGPAVPERKSSLTKSSTNDKSPSSSLEREFGSEKTGTVKRSPASSNKSTVVALVHQETNGDVSPDSGHNTSSSPIESANSPNGQSGSEFEFSECSDMEGADRIERIRVKTTINSSRIPSMCVITPPPSDDESIKEHSPDKDTAATKAQNNKQKQVYIKTLNLPLKPIETDLDTLEFAYCGSNATNIKTVAIDALATQLVNVNLQTGYATLETVAQESKKISKTEGTGVKTASSVRAPSPSGGSVTVKTVADKVSPKPPIQPILKATLMPLNSVLDRLKSNFSTFSKKDKICLKNIDADNCDESGDYVTIADVKNNNEKAPLYAETTNSRSYVIPNLKLNRDMEYVSLNELPCNVNKEEQNSTSNVSNDSLERRHRQGARVTLDAEGKVVYSSDSLKRRKGAHTTFEPGPYIKDTTDCPQSPIAIHRSTKQIRPVTNQEQLAPPQSHDSRPLSPQLGKVVIRAATGMASPTAEIVRVPPSTIVTPTIRPISPKPNRGGAYVHVQDNRRSLSPREKEPVFSPEQLPSCTSPGMERQIRHHMETIDPYGYQNTLVTNHLIAEKEFIGIPNYNSLPTRKSRFAEHYNYERPITPDIMRGLPNYHYNTGSQTRGLYNKMQELNNKQLPLRQYPKLGIPVLLPQVEYASSVYQSQVPSYTKPEYSAPVEIKPFQAAQYQKFCSSTPTRTENIYHVNVGNSSPFATNSPVAHSANIANTRESTDSLKISPIDPRSVGGFQSSTPGKVQELKAATNLENKLLSPKKSTMSAEELSAIIHQGKKKMNIRSPDTSAENTSEGPPKSPEKKIKSPETGYLKGKARSRFSWSPSDGEFVEYNTNIDKLSPSPEGVKQNCNNRKGNQQTSRLDFKKLLLQHSKGNLVSPNAKKVSAVEQLKLSKQQAEKHTFGRPEMSILELTSSPKSLQSRKISNNNGNSVGSPKAEKQKPPPKLLSPRSQWRFANPRSDVLSSTIPEDCGEDETSGSSPKTFEAVKESTKFKPIIKDLTPTKADIPSFQKTNADFKKNFLSRGHSSISQYLKAKRDDFFNVSSPAGSSTTSPKRSSEKEHCVSPPTLETAF